MESALGDSIFPDNTMSTLSLHSGRIHPASPMSQAAQMTDPLALTPVSPNPSSRSPSAAIMSEDGSTTMSPTLRRPSRKSTLTQQQKNQKRQRATQEQLATLEIEFGKHPTPTASVREQIAQDINMTERSVQIWFQNRRAKTKGLAKRTFGDGHMSEAMRRHLLQQAYDPTTGLYADPSDLSELSALQDDLGIGDSTAANKTIINHLTCKSLSIGSWRRAGQNAMDLVIFYAPQEGCMTYYINNEGAGYKIEYPFSSIKTISLQPGRNIEDQNGTLHAAELQGIRVELTRPPNFFMESAGTNGFHQCGDFTENQQASFHLTHNLGGNVRVLGTQLIKLTSSASFQRRHGFHDRPFLSVPAPGSIMGPPRPSSQPNHMIHPQFSTMQGKEFTIPAPPKGHKRQRSRSVPVAVDFSSMPPMPSFHIQKPSVSMADVDSIFAPIPQHVNALGVGHQGGLRIDTSSNDFSPDARQYPLSAAITDTGSSDFASPVYFHPHVQPDAIPTSAYPGASSMPFLSPMAETSSQRVQPSMSPLSMYSHGDPVIGDGSPMLHNTGHASPSVDLLSLNHDHQSALSDDGLLLSEMYSKQTLNMPLQSPNIATDTSTGLPFSLTDDTAAASELDLSNMVNFGLVQQDG